MSRKGVKNSSMMSCIHMHSQLQTLYCITTKYDEKGWEFNMAIWHCSVCWFGLMDL